MPVSMTCGIRTPRDACHSIRIDMEPCILGMVAEDESITPSLIASRMGRIASMPTTYTLPALPPFLMAAAMPIGLEASQHR